MGYTIEGSLVPPPPPPEPPEAETAADVAIALAPLPDTADPGTPVPVGPEVDVVINAAVAVERVAVANALATGGVVTTGAEKT
jgi:hypothetical protein